MNDCVEECASEVCWNLPDEKVEDCYGPVQTSKVYTEYGEFWTPSVDDEPDSDWKTIYKFQRECFNACECDQYCYMNSNKGKYECGTQSGLHCGPLDIVNDSDMDQSVPGTCPEPPGS